MPKITCPFCNNSEKVVVEHTKGVYFFRNCLCGKFEISEEALDDQEYYKVLKTDKQKILFSGYLRNNPGIFITNDFIEAELEGILEFCETIPLEEKIQKLEEFIYHQTTALGKAVHIAGNLYSLFYLKDYGELTNLVKYLGKVGFVSAESTGNRRWETPTLTVEGFSKIESRLSDGHLSNKVFIACEFDTNYQDELVDTIKKACSICGFDADVVSGERHNDNISNKIIADIKKSKLYDRRFHGAE